MLAATICFFSDLTSLRSSCRYWSEEASVTLELSEVSDTCFACDFTGWDGGTCANDPTLPKRTVATIAVKSADFVFTFSPSLVRYFCPIQAAAGESMDCSASSPKDPDPCTGDSFASLSEAISDEFGNCN